MTSGTSTSRSDLRLQVSVDPEGAERRAFRRHDLEQQSITIDRWEGKGRSTQPLGQLVDLSAGGLRLRTSKQAVRPEQQIRVRIELPAYAGICPFVDTSGQQLKPQREWVGWMSVARVSELDEKTIEVAGRLVDMDEMTRGMLGLYLSTQPLAA